MRKCILLSLLFVLIATNCYAKELFNIVLIGPAGSGKGTQAERLSKEMNLLPISAGEVLRKYRENPDNKYTKEINKRIDEGKLVPTKIVNEIMEEYINKNVLCDKCQWDGIIFDGYPREISQIEFIDNFLRKSNNKIDVVVYLKMSLDKIQSRLAGRYSCKKCGKIYHKHDKPLKKGTSCDICGSKDFIIRDDDLDADAIRNRLNIFTENTREVINYYKTRGMLLEVNADNTPEDITDEILIKINLPR